MNEQVTSTAPRKPRYRWRVVDIVVAALIAVTGGVIFWLWSLGAGPVGVLTAAYPPLAGLYSGGWVIPAVLGALIIRKPGAAFFCETVGAMGELLMGSKYGVAVMVSGMIQGLGAELIFAAFGYRKFTLTVALLAGGAAGLFMGLNDTIAPWGWNIAWALDHKIVYILCCVVGCAILAGVLSWLAARGLSRTGALSAFPSRNAASEPVL
ncbi:ECF transporter S component [Arthrobacter roseus]|uniref:ECF transporter S component n=1 Tax=Arthrobacter roseus TaxID=136274 RepID=UPI00196653FB|nr:ECF transporter S component [Arthrobacter roseus]MBM7849703.1 energy-coupling factor transport system substrate-specific component [Arthrobacter roseus]